MVARKQDVELHSVAAFGCPCFCDQEDMWEDDLGTNVRHLSCQHFIVFHDPAYFLACGSICTHVREE